MGVTVEGTRFRVRIIRNGKRYNLGSFKTNKEAQTRLQAFHAMLDQEDKFDKAFKGVQLKHPVFDTEYPAFTVEKPSLWDRMKSVWQSIRQRN